MLETEIKKLTAAVEALNATMSGGANESSPVSSTPPAAQATAAPAPAAAAPIPTPAPVQAAPTPVAGPVFNVATPDPGAAVVPLTFDMVKAQLSAVIQKMGDGGAAVSTLVSTYPDSTGQPAKLLSTVDASLWPDLVAKAKELINA